MFIVKILIFLLLIILGVLFIAKTDFFVRTFGKNSWFEARIGQGGTYLMWKLLGILTIIGGLIYLVKG